MIIDLPESKEGWYFHIECSPQGKPYRYLYRGFRIEPGYMGWDVTHPEYTGDEDSRAWNDSTVQEAFDAIDEWREEYGEDE